MTATRLHWEISARWIPSATSPLGDGNVYLATSDPLELYDATLKDMIDNDTVPALDKVSQIKVEGVDDYSITYDDDSHDSPCEDDVYFTTLDGEILPLDTYRVESYLDVLERACSSPTT